MLDGGLPDDPASAPFAPTPAAPNKLDEGLPLAPVNPNDVLGIEGFASFWAPNTDGPLMLVGGKPAAAAAADPAPLDAEGASDFNAVEPSLLFSLAFGSFGCAPCAGDGDEPVEPPLPTPKSPPPLPPAVEKLGPDPNDPNENPEPPEPPAANAPKGFDAAAAPGFPAGAAAADDAGDAPRVPDGDGFVAGAGVDADDRAKPPNGEKEDFAPGVGKENFAGPLPPDFGAVGSTSRPVPKDGGPDVPAPNTIPKRASGFEAAAAAGAGAFDGGGGETPAGFDSPPWAPRGASGVA